ncbi:LOW QUALITY PROTEIN: P2Y purinoceptor 3-like [Petaurus breviceps papuanus]|uniref:LOW QUALITY PROTEIN: P2Y purinoceptor 3-like n=1 Tax=Petaurus breviceps papuanus TaxID=3040969 RepID=UPI0036DD7B3F
MEDAGGAEANTSLEEERCQMVENYKRVYLPVTYSMVFVLGLPLNGLVLWLSWCRTKRWTCTTIYLSNLMVADLLYIGTLPFLIINYSLRDRWPFGQVFCRLVRFLFYANLYGSILLLTCISVHRFLGVCYPIQSMAYRTRRLALLGTGATWALVVLQALPTLVFAETGSSDGHTVCYDLSRPDAFGHFFVYGTILTLSGFVALSDYFDLLLANDQEPGEAVGGPLGAGRGRPGQVRAHHPRGVRPLHTLLRALPCDALRLPLRPAPRPQELSPAEGRQHGLQGVAAAGQP